MKQIPAVLILLFIVFPLASFGQTDCYKTFYQSGLDHYKANKFDAAIKSFKAAKLCPDKPANSDVDNKIVEAQNGYIDAIERERNKARSLALTAKSILELQKNNDATKAFRYAQYALKMDDNSESRAAFYESAYQLDFQDPRLFYQHSFSAYNDYPNDLSNAHFLEDKKSILAYSSLGQLRAYDHKGQMIAEQETSGRRGNPNFFQSSGNFIAFLEREKEALNVVDFSADQLFGNIVFSAHRADAGIRTYRFSPDGKFLAIGYDDGMIQLFDRSGTLLHSLHHNKKRIDNFSFSSDGELLVASDAGSSIQLWNSSGAFLDTIPMYRSFDIAPETAPDKRHLLVKLSSRRLQLISLKGDIIYEEKDHYGPILKENFSPDGKFVAIGDKVIILSEGSSYGDVFQEIGNNVNQIRFSPNGKYLLATGSDEKAYLWIMWGGWRPYAVLGSHTERIVSASFSADGKHILTAGKENVIKIWPLGASMAGSYSGAGKLLQALELEDSVYVITNKAEQLEIFNAYSGWYASRGLPVKDFICQSKNGRYLLTQDEDQAGIWTFGLAANNLNWTAGVTGYQNIVMGAISPTQQVAAIYNEYSGTIGLSLWDFENHKTRFLGGWRGDITSLDWSADGTQLFGGSINGELYTWDYSDGFEKVKLINKEKPHDPNPVKSIATSPDGRFLITSPLFGGDQKIRDLKNNQVTSFNCHCQTNAIHFSPDSRFFITAEDRTSRIWDHTGQLIVHLNVGNIEVKRAYFSTDGSYVVTNYADGSIMVWPFDPDLVIQKMDNYHIPDLESKEKEKYGID